MNDTGSVFSAIAHNVKQAYCDLRRRAQCVERFWPKDEKFDKYWRKAAMLCVNNLIDPREFMEVQFYVMKPWPDIPNICSDAALVRFRENRIDYATLKATELTIQGDVFTTLVERGDSPEAILTDPAQQFDSLFVYLMAHVHGLTRLAEQMEPDALLRYATSTHYNKIYGDLIPDRLKELYTKMTSERVPNVNR